MVINWLMRIRIRLITLTRIRIQLSTLIRILRFNLMRIQTRNTDRYGTLFPTDSSLFLPTMPLLWGISILKNPSLLCLPLFIPLHFSFFHTKFSSKLSLPLTLPLVFCLTTSSKISHLVLLESARAPVHLLTALHSAHGVLIAGLRIRIGSGFNRVSGYGFGIPIRIQEGKNDPQK